jgi:hypothetical protein
MHKGQARSKNSKIQQNNIIFTVYQKCVMTGWRIGVGDAWIDLERLCAYKYCIWDGYIKIYA